MKKGANEITVPSSWPKELLEFVTAPYKQERQDDYPGGPYVTTQKYEPGTVGERTEDYEWERFQRDIESINKALSKKYPRNEAGAIQSFLAINAVRRVRRVMQGSPCWNYE